MKDKILIPTPLEQNFIQNMDWVLMGVWCETNKLKKKNLNEIIKLNYYWDDQLKLENDIIYSSIIEEKILVKLSNFLNNYHNRNEKIEYWRLIVGPWVSVFCQSLLERWRNFHHSKSISKFNKVINSKFKFENFIPQSIDHFFKNTTTDLWNQYIYEEIFKNQLDESYFITSNIIYQKFNNLRPDKVKIIRKIFYYFEKILSKFLSNKNKNFISCETYLSKFEELILNFKLNSFGINLAPIYPRIKYQISKKRNLKIFEESEIKDDKFLLFINEILLKNIPLAFLENFEYLNNYLDKINWPKNPKVFFTSHCLYSKTLPSIYIANKKKNGCKILHGQHGGYYGQAKFFPLQDYELKISDKYLTWGWDKINNNKIIKFGILKKINLINQQSKNDKILFVLKGQSRYTNRLHSGAGSKKLNEYYLNCQKFTSNLKNDLKEKILLRRHARKYNWHEENKFCSMFQNKQIDNGFTKFEELAEKSKIIIHTYNSSGYLENLAQNIPTIVFWDLNLYPVNEETANFLDKLKEVNIFHSNWKSASNFLNDNYNNIESWWNNHDTKKNRKLFCEKYALLNTNKINDLVVIINKMITK